MSQSQDPFPEPNAASSMLAFHSSMVSPQSTPSRQTPQRALADVLAGCDIAVLIPCYNESLTIGKVVRDFARELPGASIYAYDNNSSDGTARIAREAGAIVRSETRQGKGHVVRRMFRDIDADLYVLVDGDDTYDASAAPLMVAEALAGPFDFINGVRVENSSDNAYRPGHRTGNQVLTGIVLRLFGNRVEDMLSGYKVLSRRFVKSFPVLSSGFEIETELTVHTLALEMPVKNVPTAYGSRPRGSSSKLNTFRDGWHIISMIVDLFKQERPLLFFSLAASVFAAASIILGVPVVIEFFQTHTVPRLPTAVLSSAIMLLAFLSFMTGLILDTVSRGRLEAKLLHYLSLPHVDRAELAQVWLHKYAAGPVTDMSVTAQKRNSVPIVVAVAVRGCAMFLAFMLLVVAVLVALSTTGILHTGISFWPFR
jgi:glycosyltransferase involved in cell wall biosynthesis